MCGKRSRAYARGERSSVHETVEQSPWELPSARKARAETAGTSLGWAERAELAAQNARLKEAKET